MRPVPLVSSVEQALRNISLYRHELAKSPGLQRVVGYAPAWYAAPGPDGTWLLAPSKFVGYQGISAEVYLDRNGGSGVHDGRETERQLQNWFARISQGSALHRQLSEELSAMLAPYGKTQNIRARFYLVNSDDNAQVRRSDRPISAAPDPELVVFNPAICSGKPTLHGTRIRVADVLGMLAAGDSIEEILADFPSLRREHIKAALSYAAEAVDHRVIRAA
jgi:uncharacterized protein (DUF433 family)